MKLQKPLFTVIAILSVIYGLGSLLMPSQTAGTLGVSLGEEANVVVRMVGILCLSLAIVAWYARDAAASPLYSGVVTAYLVGYLLSTVVHVWSAATGALVLNAAGTISIAIDALIAAGLVVLYLQKTKAPAAV